MPALNKTSERLRFGACEVDLSARELWKNGSKAKLQDQAFEILILLLRDPGALITRDGSDIDVGSRMAQMFREPERREKI